MLQIASGMYFGDGKVNETLAESICPQIGQR